MKKLTLLLVAITISLFSVATYAAPMVGVVKRAIQYGEHVVVLTHEADGTPHIYRVTNGEAIAVSLTGVVARDPDNLGDYLSISDIAVTEDGKLVACNYVRCQYSQGYVETGYKKGINRFYIWDDIIGGPSIWFTTQTTGNSNVADVGRTFALKGTSQNAEILVTAVHNNNRAVRMDLHKVVGGEYKSDSYFTFGLHTTAAYYKEQSQGVQFQLNASATTGNWYLEGELSEPSEFVVPAGKGDAYSASAVLAAGTLGKTYNGATYLTVNGKHVMVAPYSDASGDVAGVKVLDITNGLNAAELKETINLATPVAATAAATAVKADGNMLTITLVADATLHTLTTTPDHPEEIIGVVKRAIQVGEDIIVLTHEADGTPHIYRVTNGEVSIISQEGVLARDPDNAGDYLSISDIAVTTDGKLVACNYIRCQNTDAQVDAGYKKGINRFYIWDDLTGGARVWFTEQFAANSNRADMGYTMALTGSSTACNILVTARHYNVNGTTASGDGALRLHYFTINGNSVSRIRQGSTLSDNNAVYYTHNIGEEMQLSASPLGAKRFILDANKCVPSEFRVNDDGEDMTVLGRMDAATLPAQYNGATYLSIRGMHLMVAPYADGSGNVAGVKVLDITTGLDAAELKATVNLDAPVAAIATATAVQVDGNTLTITLITDATLHTLTTTIEIPEEIVGVVKRAIQLGEDIIVLTHEADGTPHIYRVTNGVATAISQKGVVARDPDNAGDYLSISDIAITDDGKLVACNKVVCQSGDDKVDSGYKRGTTRIYKWDDLAGNPKVWFTSQHSSSWYRSIQGHTMAIKGNSTNATIFMTGITATATGYRYTLFKIKEGSLSSSLGAKGTDNHTTDIIGQNYELNASPFGDANYFLDGELVEPFEMICPTVSNTEVTEGTKLAAGTLGKTYNGATYLTVNGKHLMVAPYADVSGKVGGVRVMDITNGLGGAKWLKNGVLATPVSATAAATAVKANGNTLTVTLITDATLHTFHITLDEAPAATALNPYAYNLSATWDVAAKTFTTHYTLNADAKEVYITLSDGDVEYIRKPSTGIKRGAHTYAITLTDGELAQLPSNKALTWNVIAVSDKRTEVAECATNYDLLYPTSIDIDNNPKNTSFGRIIVTESRHSVKYTDGYLSTGYGAGIYAFNPDFTPAANGTDPGYNGGNTFTNTRADKPDDPEAHAYAPRRVRISDDGRIFVTSLNTNGDVLWEVNPDNMNTWTKVFTGLTQDAKKDLYNGSTFVAGPNAGFDVRGSGADLKLLMLSANTDTYLNRQTGFRVSEYNLGTKTSWNTAPSKAFPHGKTNSSQSYFVAATNAQVQYDKDGGVWCIQHRSTSTETSPGLVHFTAEGVEDYKELRHNTNNAGFRFNSDFTKVVIAGDPTNSALKAIVYAVSKDADGKPVLTEESSINMSTVGRSQNDFAWDYANNLYVVGDVNHKLLAYAMPYSGEVTTPGASQHIFRVVEEVIVDENANNTTALAGYEGKEVIATVTRSFGPNKYLTLTLPFDMNATQIRNVFGNATVYALYNVFEYNATEVHLQFTPVSTITAGTPYILATAASGYDAEDGFTIEGVAIDLSLKPVTPASGDVTMVPVLDAGGTLNQSDEYFLSDNALYCAGTYPRTILGLRAYFESASPLPIRARVVFQDNEATSIPMVETQPANQVRKVLKDGQLIIIRGEEMYNMQGQRME